MGAGSVRSAPPLFVNSDVIVTTSLLCVHSLLLCSCYPHFFFTLPIRATRAVRLVHRAHQTHFNCTFTLARNVHTHHRVYRRTRSRPQVPHEHQHMSIQDSVCLSLTDRSHTTCQNTHDPRYNNQGQSWSVTEVASGQVPPDSRGNTISNRWMRLCVNAAGCRQLTSASIDGTAVLTNLTLNASLGSSDSGRVRWKIFPLFVCVCLFNALSVV
jgi:hypothetical protein